MRVQKAVVAIVQDDADRFLVAFNPKWGGYAFPMQAIAADENPVGSLAIQAVEHDLGCRLPNAEAKDLDYMSRFGVSQRTGEETLYEYWLCTVEPRQALNLLGAPTGNSNPPLFLTYEDLRKRTDLTWTTPSLVHDFVENQEAVLAVITRAGETETEFLLVWNNSYGGYFFPTQRVKTEVKPESVALGTVRSDLGYFGPATPRRRGEITDVHFSNRFHMNRHFRFHICEVQLPEVDLHQPGSLLEQALRRRGKEFLWVKASELSGSSIPFSPTLPAVRTEVLAVIPPRIIAQPLRRSEGGIALIERTIAGKCEWLAQWNDNWKAFFFVGGHREENESFRDCVVREIEEELGLTSAECPVAGSAAHRLEYMAISRSASELTAYTMELFAAQPTPSAAEKIGNDSLNKWLSDSEIRRLETFDARPVSVSMLVILRLAGRITCEQR